jgi:hypothetical protein
LLLLDECKLAAELVLDLRALRDLVFQVLFRQPSFLHFEPQVFFGGSAVVDFLSQPGEDFIESRLRSVARSRQIRVVLRFRSVQRENSELGERLAPFGGLRLHRLAGGVEKSRADAGKSAR